MRFKPVVGIAILALAIPAVAIAQTAPAPPPNAPPAPNGPPAPTAPRPPRHPVMMDSAFALGSAYRAIGRAEQAGATGHYIDAARTHYRSAIDRHNRNDDTGASAEARLASDLARVALDERPANAYTGPKDIPAPPTPRAMAGHTMDGMPPGAMGEVIQEHVMRVMGPDGPMGPGRAPMVRVMGGDGFTFGSHRGFDATSLAQVLRVEKSAEAHQLAQNAVDANAAAQKAALNGNVAEAARQSRIANDLATAVHDLAALNHPELHHGNSTFRVTGDLSEMNDMMTEALSEIELNP